MIKIENTEVYGWEAAIRGMRNPMNSWDKSDSKWYSIGTPGTNQAAANDKHLTEKYCIGNNDLDLMKRLRNAGTDHRKFMRMITVTADIVAPTYWWAEYDTYKIGTVANSCSKMHKLLSKPFEISDFSFDKLLGFRNDIINGKYKYIENKNTFEEVAKPLINILNELRDSYFSCESEMNKKVIWYSIIQLLPSSYNQRRTVMLNYEVLTNIYHARKNHKLDEWHDFCHWVETLPYAKELIIGEEK